MARRMDAQQVLSDIDAETESEFEKDGEYSESESDPGESDNSEDSLQEDESNT